MPFCFLFLEDGPSVTQRHLTAIPESTGISSFFSFSIFPFLNHSINVPCYKIILLSVLFTAPCSAIGSETDLRAGVVSLIPAGPILSWRLIVKYVLWSFSVISYKRKYVHEVLVNRLVKLVQEKVWVG